VGSFVSKRNWVTAEGHLVQRNATVGATSTFSGSGPSSDGRFAPDVVAPGEFVASTLSRLTPPDAPAAAFHATPAHCLYADDGAHALLRGTSQAAPHVTGAVALLYQVDPTLTTDALRELLRTAARPEPGAAGYSPRSGFGHLDVATAVDLVMHRFGDVA